MASTTPSTTQTMAEQVAAAIAAATASKPRQTREVNPAHSLLAAIAEALNNGKPAADVANLVSHAVIVPPRGQAQMCDLVTAALRDGTGIPPAPKPNAQYRLFRQIVASLRSGLDVALIAAYVDAAAKSDSSTQASFFDTVTALLNAATPTPPVK